MSHIGEGDLQAYLDGAYEVLTPELRAEIERRIEVDEDFKAQVDEARATRALASKILADAAPTELSLPPFEELQRRAAAAPDPEPGQPKRWIGLPPIVGMGWAATVILALGVGWFAGQGAGGAPPFSQTRDEAGQGEAFNGPEEAAALNEVVGGLGGEEAAVPGDAVASVPADEKKAAGQEAAPGFELADRAGERPSTVAGPPATRSLDELDRTGAGDPVEERAAGRRQNTPAAEPPAPAQASRPDAAGEVTRQEADPQQRREVASSLEAEAEEQLKAKADVTDQDRNRALGSTAPARDVSLLRTADDHAFHSLALPGLEVLSVTLDEAGALSGLKILHRLPAGDTLELRYVGLFSQTGDPRGAGRDERVETEALPALAAQIQEAALPPGWRQVVVRKENRWVVARAPISEAQIRAYLMTLN